MVSEDFSSVSGPDYLVHSLELVESAAFLDLGGYTQLIVSPPHIFLWLLNPGACQPAVGHLSNNPSSALEERQSIVSRHIPASVIVNSPQQ